MELYAKPLSEIPIKKISYEEQKHFIEKVDQILAITTKSNYDPYNVPEKVREPERQIDQMVYELYGLTDEEIKIVEEC